MDLRLYAQVFWRFRLLMAAGFAIAFMLAFLAMVKVSPSGKPHLTYRSNEQWLSYSTLFITQPGFPWGRSIIPTKAQAEQAAAAKSGVTFADPSRFSDLAVLYAQLATSDQVRSIMRRGGKIDGDVSAQPVTANDNPFAAALPLIRISVVAKTQGRATSLVERATDAFRKFLSDQQAANQIPASQRVVVSVVQRHEKPKLLQGRSRTVPIVVFLAIMILFGALAFVLENLRPRVRPVAAEAPAAASARDAA